MAKESRLFRKVSLERLASPEELDQVLEVTTPRGWIALATLAGLILVALMWGIFGSLPTKISGTGMFITGEGVKDISAPTSGQLTTVYVSPGDLVERGQMVARLAQPELVTGISHTRTRMQELETTKELIRTNIQIELEQQRTYSNRETARIEAEIANLRERIASLEERRENQKTLLGSGLITQRQLLSTEEEIRTAEQTILQLSNEKLRIPIALEQLMEKHQERIRAIDARIREVERELEEMEQRMDDASKVYSPHSGRILEVPVGEGSLVSAGVKIATLELADESAEDLVMVLYVSAAMGKQVKPGSNAHLSPTTIKAEEHGSILGLVTSVGGFPATQQGMMRILRNERLVQQLSQGGAPIEIFVSPIPSSETFSGFQWTSGNGPDQIIRSGTMATGSIIVSEQAPITLVIPWLRKNILGIGS
jgi:HlyD family secretion protein